MSILTQKTISKKISFSGVGIHTGNAVNMNILPASPNTGIVFKRLDIQKNNIVYPLYNNVVDTTLCTTISNTYGVQISTIEHLMGAFYGIGIDNAIVELDSKEVPIMDGSAKLFLEGINNAGIKFSDQPIKIIKINREISFEDSEKFISINKSNVTSDIQFEIKYDNEGRINIPEFLLSYGNISDIAVFTGIGKSLLICEVLFLLFLLKNF